MRIPTPFDDVQLIDRRKRHIRQPVALLLSRRHSSTANVTYALYDVMGGDWGPVEADREWQAGRLSVTVSGLAKSINSLSKPHTGKTDLDPDLPVFVQSEQRGYGKTALRRTLPGVPYVEVPEWTLGDSTYGLLVSAPLWRLYVLLLYKRTPGYGTVALKGRELAQLARVRQDSLPGMIRSLETARLVVKQERPGRPSVLLPVTVQLNEVEYAAVAERLAATCAQSTASCGEPVDTSTNGCGQPEEPAPSTGTAPHPSTGTAPHPSTGISIEGVLSYEDMKDVDPVVGRAAPSERTHRPKSKADVGEGSSPPAAAIAVLGRSSWRDPVDQFRVAVVDADRMARTRELIEQARTSRLAVAA